MLAHLPTPLTGLSPWASRSYLPLSSEMSLRPTLWSGSHHWSRHEEYMLYILFAPQEESVMAWSSGSVVAIPRGQPLPLSQLPHLTHPIATRSAVPMTAQSAPRVMAFATSIAVLSPPLATSVTWSLMPSLMRNLCTLGIAYSIGIAMF